MKPIHLNLASRPYRDYTPVNLVAASMFVLMLILAWLNFNTMLRYKVETKATRAKLAKVETDIEHERKLQGMSEQRLTGLDLNRLGAQTKFVNAQLAQRAFSWSTLLDELESVLPEDVRILSIAPAFTETGEITLGLTFHTKSTDGMVRTINSMNADPEFRDPFPSNESQIEGGYAFDLSVRYLPPGLPLKRGDLR